MAREGKVRATSRHAIQRQSQRPLLLPITDKVPGAFTGTYGCTPVYTHRRRGSGILRKRQTVSQRLCALPFKGVRHTINKICVFSCFPAPDDPATPGLALRVCQMLYALHAVNTINILSTYVVLLDVLLRPNTPTLGLALRV